MIGEHASTFRYIYIACHCFIPLVTAAILCLMFTSSALLAFSDLLDKLVAAQLVKALLLFHAARTLDTAFITAMTDLQCDKQLNTMHVATHP